MSQIPKPLALKLIAQLAIGFFCTLVGCVYGVYSSDHIFIIMSLLILACSMIQAVSLYRLVQHKSYITLEGVCTKREPARLKKTQQLFFKRENVEFCITLQKNVRILQGHSYRLYLKKQVNSFAAKDSISGDFLAYEEISLTDCK